MNPLQQLSQLGQSVWLDSLDRDLLESGRLQRLVEQDGLKGVTSNPTIFEQAISGSEHTLPAVLRALEQNPSAAAEQVYEELAVADIQRACDILRPVYAQTQCRDGYVSLEVSPRLARDAARTMTEGQRLWRRVARPNLMIKVPGTAECLPAIRGLISEGINVNVTLLFSITAYEQAAQATMQGLRDRLDAGNDIARVASVASFFISRIDTAVDKHLYTLAKQAAPEHKEQLHALLGKAAIANAKAAHAKRGKLHATPSWQELAGKGACPQRLLWASTGTKDPKYSDVLYVEELAGPDTVNTMPMKTLDAFRDHGAVADRLNQAQDQAQNVLRSLAEEGISLNDITDELLRDGIAKFTNSFDKLLAAVQGKLAFARHHLPPNQPDAVFQVGPLSARLPRATLAKPIRDALVTLDRWTLRRNVARLWAKDGALWTGGDESAWMGWLDAAHQPLQQGGQDLTKTPWQNTYKHVVLLGMGGSSLAPEVLAHVYGDTELKPSTRIHGDCGDGRTSDHRGDNGKVARLIQTGHPAIPSIPLICGTSLHVLDTTDPAQIGQLREQLPLEDTLFIVSSKSGTTLETELLRDFFWHETRQKLGEEQAGSHFIAVTDPGTPLEQFAQAKGFACVFQGEPSIGGRYSALSPFGLVPALALGIPLQPLAEQAKAMADACAYSVAPADNPAVLLGILLGALARHGRNKVTFITDEKTKALGAWLEQLLAESTGKQKQGVIPIDGEELGETTHYGSDRVFVWLDSTASVPCHPERSDSDAKNLPTDRNAGRSFVLRTQDDKAGHPVIRLHVAPHEGIAQQFVLWEIATAVLGSVLGINPFDQPDVEASKQRTRTFMQDAEQTGRLSPLSWTKQENGLCVLIADAGDSGPPKDNSASVVEILRNHLAQLSSGDCFSPPSPLSDIQPSVKSHESESYFGLLAFLPRHDACVATLNRIRHRVHQTKRVATTAGFGPRFLHSIGQLYKGGPRQGVFVTITCDDQPDLPIPDRSYGFRAVKEAQARGDFAVVAERGQRILRIHMRGELDDGLRRLERVFTEALTLHKR